MKSNFYKKLRYKIENELSKGNSSVILLLGLIMIVIMLVCAAVFTLIDFIIGAKEGIGFLEAINETFYQLLAPGAIDWERPSYYLIIMALLCLFSLFIASILIGLISAAISDKIEEIRRGRSVIQEKDHVIIYGFSPKIFIILKQLIEANSNKKKFCIAVMTDADKVELESTIREKIDDFKTTRLVVRSGNPNDIEDVNIMMPQHARSIVVLPQDSEYADINVVKTLMAIINNPIRKKGKYSIITEINDPGKREVAEIISGDEATIISTTDTISRLMVQTALQPGLSNIYNEFLSFEGNEIYFKNYTDQMGSTFGEVSLYFANAIPMGFLDSTSKLVFCPSKDTIIPAGSILVCMAEDDDSFVASNNKSINYEIIKPIVPRVVEPENSLVIGWNLKSSLIVKELDNYAQPGSVITILSILDISEEVDALKNEIKNCNIEVLIGDTTDDVFLLSSNLNRFQHVILLSYDHISDEDADAHTLVSLIQLRNLSNKLGTHFNIVSEMKDLRNKTLAELTKPDDFIIGNNITSLLLTQLSENPTLLEIYKEIFNSSGSEIYLRPIDNYIQLGVSTSFNTLTEAAMRRGEVALGYKTSSISKNYGIVLNPSKQANQTFGIGDKLIVLSF